MIVFRQSRVDWLVVPTGSVQTSQLFFISSIVSSVQYKDINTFIWYCDHELYNFKIGKRKIEFQKKSNAFKMQLLRFKIQPSEKNSKLLKSVDDWELGPFFILLLGLVFTEL